jgi:hypothetical protein
MNCELKICTKCILPETFPGISFNQDGLCSHCQKSDGRAEKLCADKRKYEQKFLALIKQVCATSGHQNSYDILMAYSGGKDSTFTMSLLRTKYELRVLAVSFDNGFVSDTARANIAKVTDALQVDHIFFKPPWGLLKEIFTAASERELYSKKTLERASTMCTSCIGLVKSICLKTAIEQEIPLIGYGWSPGQAPIQSAIMRNNPALARMSQQSILKPLREIVGEGIEPYFLGEKHYAAAERFPYNVHPMAWEFYNEEMILDKIGQYGWIAPGDTDSNSTNCLLNAYANDIHLKKYGFHPYVWEIANMVRDGVMDRDKGFEKIYTDQSQNLIITARKKLET